MEKMLRVSSLFFTYRTEKHKHLTSCISPSAFMDATRSPVSIIQRNAGIIAGSTRLCFRRIENGLHMDQNGTAAVFRAA